MEHISCDLLVIGAGSAGLSVAAGASQMGARVVLLEANEMGGDCLNAGCVPSKALLASAARAHAQAHGAAFGLGDLVPQVDYSRVQRHVQGVIAQITPVDSQKRFESLGVQVIRAKGRFVDHQTVEAGAARIMARRIVVATGSRPYVPPIAGLAQVPYLTNESLWTLNTQPEHLIILGGGPIGLEMAQAHRRLGCQVTVIEAQKALAREDPEAAQILLARLRAEGIEILEHTAATHVSQRGSAQGAGITVTTEAGTEVVGTHLLVAVGRRANVDGLNLTAAGIDATEAGIVVDAGLRSSNRRVYAIGDVAGQGQFTHLAGYHASVVLKSSLFGLPSKAATHHIPRAIYTDPEIAQVGLSEAEARAKYADRLEVARFDYHHNDRALATHAGLGFIKVMVVRGRPVGATIVGQQAGELIATWSLALANNLKMSQIAAMVVPYPTLAELNKRVVGAYFSPRLFDSSGVRRGVRFVQRWLP